MDRIQVFCREWTSPKMVVLALTSVTVIFLFFFQTWLLRKGPSSTPASSTTPCSVEAKPIVSLNEFDWTSQEPSKYRPFKPIYHITMALQSDTPSELITIDRDYHTRIKLRERLIAKHGNGTHGHVLAGADAVQELYSYLLSDYLPRRYPTIFELSKDNKSLRNKVTQDSAPTNPPRDVDAALRILGNTIEEDLFMLKPTPEGHQCVAFMCCFPSGWNPASKLGKNMNQIHTSVPSYEKIGPSMERFFGKLQAGQSVKRTNWTIQTHDELFNATGNHLRSGDEVEEEDIVAGNTFVRVELQTLSRLPKSHSILFSFKTYLYPIQSIKDEGLGPDVADAIEGLKKGNAPDMWKYKSAARWGASACRYLRS